MPVIAPLATRRLAGPAPPPVPAGVVHAPAPVLTPVRSVAGAARDWRGQTIWRLSSFKRVICPSTGPVLQDIYGPSPDCKTCLRVSMKRDCNHISGLWWSLPGLLALRESARFPLITTMASRAPCPGQGLNAPVRPIMPSSASRLRHPWREQCPVWRCPPCYDACSSRSSGCALPGSPVGR